ncbi:uncharacterized protein LOC129571263 [Sitodiplosis mosellana]|uniref:uncharacterized protein LOC129571263 n=1 Tax=Sitodiplosis mosellana TaxID=263140 RepID=UPI0024450585|nr:uncharacterized protein LOC129571263 [Sitodiplosis mosellana]XP_055307016.1 uncharacterized protein LOC129571263 [Sitodiplosis mosellana]
MSLNDRLRKRKSVKANFIPENESDIENRDPFHVSFGDEEPDYVPPSKKPKQSIKKGVGQRKKRTRRERLARLSLIAEKYAQVDVAGPSSNSIEQDKMPAGYESTNIDNLFESIDSNEKVINDEYIQPGPTEKSQSLVESQHTDSDLESVIQRLEVRMDEMVNSILLIRKQLCRIEMKTHSSPFANERSPSYMTDVEENELFDLQKTLVREGLPLRTSSEVENFEARLENQPEFRRKLIALLSVLNGASGDKNGSKVIKSIVDEIIQPSCQHLFSMTGKSGPGLPRKVAFEGYSELIGIIFATCLQADRTYTLKRCMHDLTYRILKRGNAQRDRIEREKNEADVIDSNQLVGTFTVPEQRHQRSETVASLDQMDDINSIDVNNLMKLILNNIKKSC